jgi:Icc-related predicted phosphoesterase
LRIGVISDTHNNLGNVARIVELLNRAAVDRVVHTGDITQPKTLEVLARLAAPLYGGASSSCTIRSTSRACRTASPTSRSMATRIA